MSNKMALDALKFAEAALADIGDADREPGDDLAWCEARAAEALPQTRAAIAALRAMDAEARKRGEMYPQTRDEQEADTKAVRNVIESLEFYTSGRQVGANGWPGIKDWPALPVASTVAALKAERDAALARVAVLEKDAARYRWLRRGQKWSVVDGIGTVLRADELDAAIDAALTKGQLAPQPQQEQSK